MVSENGRGPGGGQARMAVLLLAAALAALALRWHGLTAAGVTRAEAAAAAAAAPAAGAGVFEQLPRIAPAGVLATRLAGMVKPAPLLPRVCALAAGVCAVLLLVLIARRSAFRATVYWAAGLAVCSVPWIALSQQATAAGIGLCCVLAVFLGFAGFWDRPGWPRLFVHAAVCAVAGAIEPRVFPVMAAQGVCVIAGMLFPGAGPRRAVRSSLGSGALILLFGFPAACALLGVLTQLDQGCWALMARNAIAAPALIWQAFRCVAIAAPPAELGNVYAWSPVLTACMAVLALIGIAAAFALRRGDERLWLCQMLAVLLARAGDAETVAVMAAPAALLLAAGGFGAVTHAVARCRAAASRAPRIAGAAVLTALLAAAGTAWVAAQYRGLSIWRCQRAEDDLRSTVLFLESAVHPDDTLLLVKSGDPSRDALLGVYVEPFVARGPVKTVAGRTADEWRGRAAWLTPPQTGSLWACGFLGQQPAAATDIVEVRLPFAVPAACVARAAAWSGLDTLDILRKAARAAPSNRRIAFELLAWYRTVTNTLLRRTLLERTAGADIHLAKGLPGLAAYRRRAANLVLYAWDEMGDRSFSTYDAFDSYVRAAWGAPLDRERVLYLYRLYAEEALSMSNVAFAVSVVTRGEELDADDPYMIRLRARILQWTEPRELARVQSLNQRARREFLKRYGQPYVDAWLGVISVLDQQGNMAGALDETGMLLAYLRDGFRIPQDIETNETEYGEYLRQWWREQLLTWEMQGNALQARFLATTGDYTRAFAAEQRTLSPRFGAARRRGARERLAALYSASGNTRKAIEQWDLLASSATSVLERVAWLLEVAQHHVTMNDAVAAYEYWTRIQDNVAGLSQDDRFNLARDKRYERILRHLQSRMSVDLRDTVLPALRARADADPSRAGWYLEQAAYLQRCKLEYDKAADTFAEGMKRQPSYPGTYLGNGMMHYRLTRYRTVRQTVSNLFLHVRATNVVDDLQYDWRYRVLVSFYRDNVPPTLNALLAWADDRAAEFTPPARYQNYRGNILAHFDDYDAATNVLAAGIAQDPSYLETYLDYGYLICTRADADAAGALLDRINTLPLDAAQRRSLAADWRFIELHHVSARPYVLPEN
ncbi:hypothetical protein GX586_15225 [bacterium]|nr:hypothetical protein [bacterium]